MVIPLDLNNPVRRRGRGPSAAPLLFFAACGSPSYPHLVGSPCGLDGGTPPSTRSALSERGPA